MSGITNQLRDLIKAFIDANGQSWLALMPGGLYGPNDIPDCATGSLAYGMFSWIGNKDIRTASELRDEYRIQFKMYSDDERLLADIWDECFFVLDSTFYEIKDVGFKIQLRKDHDAPGLMPVKSQEKSRFSKFVCMAQFWCWVERIYT